MYVLVYVYVIYVCLYVYKLCEVMQISMFIYLLYRNV